MSDPHPDLLPCPFCGERRIFLNEPADGHRYGSVNCPACLVHMPEEVRDAEHHELIDCWNTRATGWQPIETAPKDGSKIDLLFEYPRGRQNECQWREGGIYGDGDWYWSKPQWGCQPGLGIDWHLLPESEWTTEHYPNMAPTHWMPLPAPPTTEDLA
jgi:hypothetical protein